MATYLCTYPGDYCFLVTQFGGVSMVFLFDLGNLTIEKVKLFLLIRKCASISIF
jgi:hypothetical protein